LLQITHLLTHELVTWRSLLNECDVVDTVIMIACRCPGSDVHGLA
jgi:hypothetical protein